MSSRTTLLFAAAVCLCSCDRMDASSPAPAASSEGMRTTPDGRLYSETVLRNRRAMGRWRSEAGVLNGSRGQWIVIDVAGTLDVRMEVRTTGARFDTVTAFANGKAVVNDTGVDATLSGASGALADFASFKATFPTTGSMRVVAASGRVLDLTYDGQ